ncbi:RWD domain-containing protein like [Verticillium longisporum]|uniref:RWD domain-containing protein n=2 Tax=Verticillium TaxID=1036719 RepID=A0A2J8CBL8_VERDA|nr:RWD domain-containing protein like [Verticillium longisporum]PNH34426.1 hypothetical protein BJF96_g2301 [Verticillium dahliae]PNH37961.1 hypothetical protein VD0004_g8848 [Verticillium dahliae]PNH50475.1 hypothetical protein VD0003_g6713 [Verticillium dahliae]PNH64422.1 hypothetical protein VD0001_g8843 [Verticillium dahliae]
MGREEQVEEREVLESIFPEEITDISETEFRIKVVLDVVGEEDAPEPPTMLLHVRYPEAYPDEAPFLDLNPEQQAGAPHPHFSVADDKAALLASLGETVEENLGVAMVFSLYATLKDAAEQLIADRKAAVERRREEAVMAAEREENKKFQGTPVTPETFLRWRDDFRREMDEARLQLEEERLAELKKAKVKEPVRMTGRQLWEGGLVGKVTYDEGDDEDGGLTEGVEKLKVEAA